MSATKASLNNTSISLDFDKKRHSCETLNKGSTEVVYACLSMPIKTGNY